MINKASLLNITDLKLEGILKSMDDSMFKEYYKELKTFIDEYPKHETILKESFASKNTIEFSKELLSVTHMLKKIRAHDLEKSCMKLLNDIKTEEYAVTEAFLNYVITSISMLSIDIQMLMYQEAENIKSEASEVQEEAEKIVKGKVLAVDDVSLILNMLKTILRDTPHDFVGVTSGAAALKYLNNNDPSLFLLDIEMPEMNGYELALQIRNMKKTAPIIFLTGNATKEYVKKAIMVGAADFIVKPVNKEQVLEKINKYIRVEKK